MYDRYQEQGVAIIDKKEASLAEGASLFAERYNRLNNWGRWGSGDELGALNLITPQKIKSAASLVVSGDRISMSRALPTEAAPNNPRPATHDTHVKHAEKDAGVVIDEIAISYHGQSSTHLDALCHIWDGGGMWNGRDPEVEISGRGSTWASVDRWSSGICTRGVLLDVAQHRPGGFVDSGFPVSRDELQQVADSLAFDLEPGDALVVNCGRGAWESFHGKPWGSAFNGEVMRPGLDASCLEFFWESDCSVILWDMMDCRPNEFGVLFTVHAALHRQGVALVDNCLLEPLADHARTVGRYSFMVTVLPLVVVGGTGSPVNPLAVF